MLGRNPLTEKKGRMINAWPCASRATFQKIASAAGTTGGGELRFGLRFHCQHARVKFGRRKWLAATTGATGDRALSYSRCIVVQPKFDQCSLSRTKMNRLRQNESQQLECGVFRFRGLVEFRSGWILIKNEAVSRLSIAFA
jgi:hypothetical protein